MDTQKIKAIVPCTDANGVPTFFVASVRATQEEIDKGKHYTTCKRQAEREGVDVPCVSVIMDEEDAKLSAFGVLFDIIVFAIEKKSHGEKILGLLREAKEKLGVARGIVDPTQENGERVPFGQELIEKIEEALGSFGGHGSRG